MPSTIAHTIFSTRPASSRLSPGSSSRHRSLPCIAGNYYVSTGACAGLLVRLAESTVAHALVKFIIKVIARRVPLYPQRVHAEHLELLDLFHHGRPLINLATSRSSSGVSFIRAVAQGSASAHADHSDREKMRSHVRVVDSISGIILIIARPCFAMLTLFIRRLGPEHLCPAEPTRANDGSVSGLWNAQRIREYRRDVTRWWPPPLRFPCLACGRVRHTVDDVLV